MNCLEKHIAELIKERDAYIDLVADLKEDLRLSGGHRRDLEAENAELRSRLAET